MKRALLILIFAFAFIFAFSIVAFATDESTYYVVQSEDSALAQGLLAEGKNVVGIEKLYASKGDSTASGTTYFVSQFDGKVLNLILAENVSYCMGTNPSNPTGSGIRLDKAVTMNVYFNGHYWWIPDDNRYAGFFINNQNAHLTLIGDRTLEEVSASFDLSTVNAKTTSKKVDYYGGYIGFYIEKGDLTIKNAVIIGEDEVIYQKDNNASGKTTLTLDNCMVNNKDKSCKSIVLRSEGKADVTLNFNHAYIHRVQINNILEGSAIKNSKMELFYTDSWRANDRIGLDYIYIDNCQIAEYTAIADTQHIVARDSTFGKIDLIGDTSGGGYATLINSEYSSINLKRKGGTRNATLYIVTEGDCTTAAARTVYTYDDATSTIVSSFDEQYSIDNPAVGHDTKGKMTSIYYENFSKNGACSYICSTCGTEHTVQGVAKPLFTPLGYSSSEKGKGGIAVEYSVNNEAIKEYEKVTGNVLKYGVFAAAKQNLGNNYIFGSDGTASSNTIAADVSDYELVTVALKITGFTDKYKDTELALGLYTAVSNSEATEYSYIQPGKPKEGERYELVTYNLIANPPVTELVMEDVILEANTNVVLNPTINLDGKEIDLTYHFSGNNISIDNYILTGINQNTETIVTVKGDGVEGTFKVRVTEPTNYKYVVVIGVDGAGAYFQNANTPNIDEIFANGAVTYNCLTSNPTISAECWGSLLHGVVPTVHGLTNGVVSSTAYPNDSKYPSYFRVIRENDGDATLASFCNWSPINTGIIENDIGVYKVNGGPDSALTTQILTYLSGNNPTALFVQFDEADGTGHSQGYGTDAQLAKISEIDGYIGQIYGAYKDKGILDQTLFIVTADHGGNGKSHGGLTDTEKYVMFAAAGKTVEKGTIEDMEIRDTASIVLYALGYEAPKTWTSRVPSGLFKGVVAGERPIYVDKDSSRYHETEQTPKKDSDGYVTNYVTDHNLSAYLTFDGSTEDSQGGYTTEQGGTLYFIEDGYYGQAVKLDDGYVSIKDYTLGKDSFTIAFWINTQGTSSDPCIISNKDWYTGKNQGFALALRNTNDVRLNFGDGYNRVDCDVVLPSDYKQGWMHVIMVVDRENNMIGVSFDFGEMKFVEIPASLQDDSVDTKYNCINIGQDGTGKYSESLPASLDELMIFDGAFTADDVNDLASYYSLVD